jgi:hypothetical protein
MKLKILLVASLFYTKLAIAQTLQSVTDNGSVTSNFIKITGQNNPPNGLGLEFYTATGNGYISSYDRGGSNTFMPLRITASDLIFTGNATFNNSVLATTFTGNLIGNSTTTDAVAGTVNYVPKFSAGNKIGNSAFSIEDHTHGINWAYDPNYAALSFNYNGVGVIKLSIDGSLYVPNGTLNVKDRIKNNGQYLSTGPGIGFVYNTEDNLYSEPLSIWKTQGAEKMRLTSDGKLGVNTIMPRELLDVNGNIMANSFIGDLTGNASTSTTTAAISGTFQSLPRFTSANTIGNSAMSEDDNHMISSKSFYVTGTNPGLKLVGDDLSYYPSISFSSTAPNNTGVSSIQGNLGLLTICKPGGSIRFVTGAAAENRLVISDNGTVDISKDLNVSATVRSKEVKVTMNGWPDFVFEKSYELTSLPEIEKYIKLNKHLPEIPSAIEIEKNGLNLGDMDKRLLQKIEELTLHLIQKDKEIKELKVEVGRLNDLEAKVNKLLNP